MYEVAGLARGRGGRGGGWHRVCEVSGVDLGSGDVVRKYGERTKEARSHSATWVGSVFISVFFTCGLFLVPVVSVWVCLDSAAPSPRPQTARIRSEMDEISMERGGE